MIDFGPFQFASAPRTGTTWVAKAAAIVGYGEYSKAQVHIPFSERTEKLRVSCIRHPCDWLVSYFTMIYPAFTGIEGVDIFRRAQTDDFDLFIKRYLRWYPGAVGAMFHAYGADSFLKLEELPLAFDELLEMFGVGAGVRAKCNVLSTENRAVRRKPLWDPGLRQKVMAAESEFMHQFDYI